MPCCAGRDPTSGDGADCTRGRETVPCRLSCSPTNLRPSYACVGYPTCPLGARSRLQAPKGDGALTNVPSRQTPKIIPARRSASARGRADETLVGALPINRHGRVWRLTAQRRSRDRQLRAAPAARDRPLHDAASPLEDVPPTARCCDRGASPACLRRVGGGGVSTVRDPGAWIRSGEVS
jgi:hypothetical protein